MTSPWVEEPGGVPGSLAALARNVIQVYALRIMAANPPDITAPLTYGGQEFRVGLYREELPLREGGELVHFQPTAEGEQDALALGRLILPEHVQNASENGRVSEAQRDRVLFFAGVGSQFPPHSRRLTRKPFSPHGQMQGADEVNRYVNSRAPVLAGLFEAMYGDHKGGKLLPDVSGAGAFLDLLLRAQTAPLLRESDYVSPETVGEHTARRRAIQRLHEATEAGDDTEDARKSLQESDAVLDERYDQYEARVGQLVAMDPEDAARSVDNLRKRRRFPQGKSFVRLLATEAEDAGVYWPYAAAMQLVLRELRTAGELEEVPSQSWYLFMHGQHEFLSGIVPAIHPIGWRFRVAEEFRQAVAVRASENLDGQGSRSLETVCRFNGALLAVVESYAAAVENARGADTLATAKEAAWNDTGRTRSLDEERDAAVEDSELIDIDEVGAHYEGEGAVEPLDLEQISELLPAEQAKWLEVWIRRNGRAGHPKCAVQDLAEEFGVDRATIWRWCQKARSVLEALADRHGFELPADDPD
jgi:hypothetical protein